MKLFRIHLFYGWYVLSSAFVILFLVQGARSVIGVAFKPIINEFAWNRSAISLAVFMNMTVFALTLTLVGKYYDRYGAKRVVVVSTLFIAAGYTGMALVNTLWQFLIFYGIIAAVGFGGTSVPLFAALTSKWFHRHRGLAISLALAGGCLGQYVIVPFCTRLVINYSWRTAFVTMGLLILIVNLVLALTLIKDAPAELNLRAFGETNQEHHKRGRDETTPVLGHEDFSLTEAMRTPSFWLFMTVMFVCGGGDFMVITHLVPMVTDCGISEQTAGNMLAWYGLLSLAGVLATGRATDKIGHKIPLILTFIIRALIFLLILKYQNTVSFYIFALVFGFTMLITAPITTTLLGKLYGFKNVGLITGVITTVHHLSGGLWAYCGGLVFDQTGSYRAIFILYTIAALLAVACGILIQEKRHTLREAYAR